MRAKVLWIEEEANGYLAPLVGPVHASGKYDLSIERNATGAVEAICRQKFDAVIVDIRIPPGDSTEWQSLYYSAGENRVLARLGMRILKGLFLPEASDIRIDAPDWIVPARFGVLTVESKEHVNDDLAKMGIETYMQKSIGTSAFGLKEIIERVLACCQGSGPS